MFSAKGAPSLLILGQRPRIKYAFEQALKTRLNNVGRRNQAQRPRRAARLTRAFSACRDFYFIPAALPQAKIEAAPSALRVITDNQSAAATAISISARFQVTRDSFCNPRH